MLVTEVLAGRTTYALIDRNARKGEKPSDHTPVFIDTDALGADWPVRWPQAGPDFGDPAHRRRARPSDPDPCCRHPGHGGQPRGGLALRRLPEAIVRTRAHEQSRSLDARVRAT